MTPQLIVLDVDTDSSEELFRLVNHRLTRDALVGETFLAAVSRREETYPTGLDFGHACVAIPHIDPDHVRCPGILLCRNASQTIFHAMDDPERELQVALSIWPLVTDPSNQIGMLTAVIELMQSHDGYQALLHGSGAELRDRLEPVLAAVEQ